LVNSASEAKAAVAAAHYPPFGVRGYAFCRANEHGMRFDEYANAARAETIVIVMIESAQAVRDIDAIVSVDGVDGVMVGPYDLSGSLGVPGKPDHTLVIEALASVVAACNRAGKAAGFHIVQPEPETIRRSMEQGYTFLALGMDTVFLAKGAQEAISLASDGRRSSTVPKNQ
jgi:2-keto-3-deoxy-L-rhamnonate aldolase RhmA